MTILGERWGGMKVEVAHTQVQGESAPDQMIRALQHFNSEEILPEIIVFIRGGGSADDLSAFNDELLVRAIAASRVPTIVGVGHEVDVTLADLAADVRAATPSNAAQIIVPDKRELIGQARHNVLMVTLRTEQAIEGMRRSVAASMQLAVSQIEGKHTAMDQRLASVRSQLSAYNPSAVLRRGYALVRGEVCPGSEITIERLHDTITAEVHHVESH